MLKKPNIIASEIFSNKIEKYFIEKDESMTISSEYYPSDSNTTLQIDKKTIKLISGRKRLTRALSENIATELQKYNQTVKVLPNGNMQITPVPEVIKI